MQERENHSAPWRQEKIQTGNGGDRPLARRVSDSGCASPKNTRTGASMLNRASGTKQ